MRTGQNKAWRDRHFSGQNKQWEGRRNTGHNSHNRFYESNGPDVKVRVRLPSSQKNISSLPAMRKLLAT